MKILLLLLMLTLINLTVLTAYTGPVHRYILEQALEYVSHIYQFDNFSAIKDSLAVKALLENAVDEDKEDWIYGYGSDSPRASKPWVDGVSDLSKLAIYGYINTITHFWDADKTEQVNSSGHDLVEGRWLNKKYAIHSVPSAQRKAERMIYGAGSCFARELDFRYALENSGFNTVPDAKVKSKNVILHSANSSFRYSIKNLDDYVLGHNIIILGHYLPNGKLKYYRTPYHVHLTDRDWSSLKYQTGCCEEYRYLGRLAHLLSDMSVPTHTHNDIHGVLPKLNEEKFADLSDCDQYEGWIIPALNTRGGYLYNTDNIRWTADDIARVYGYALLPLPSGINDRQFLFDLFYSVNQISSMFPSNDCDGNFTADPNHPFTDYPFILEMQSRIMDMYDGSSDFQKHKGQSLSRQDLDNIQSVSIPLAVRAVATLLYWWGRHYHYPYQVVTEGN